MPEKRLQRTREAYQKDRDHCVMCGEYGIAAAVWENRRIGSVIVTCPNGHHRASYRHETLPQITSFVDLTQAKDWMKF